MRRQIGNGTLSHNDQPIATVHYNLYFLPDNPKAPPPEVSGSLTVMQGEIYLPHNGEPLLLELEEGERLLITVQPKNEAVPDGNYTIHIA